MAEIQILIFLLFKFGLANFPSSFLLDLFFFFFSSFQKIASEVNLQNLVGTPYNVVHKSHVNFDYQWTGDAVAEAFEYKEKIGQGYAFHFNSLTHLAFLSR